MLRLAIYQIINRNWQKYRQGLCPSLIYLVEDKAANPAFGIIADSANRLNK